MKLPDPFRRRRPPASPQPPPPPQRPDPSSTTRPNGEIELRGHSSIVSLLTTVPTADGVLLASGDTEGAVMLWEGRTGEHVAGPVTVDDHSLSDLAAIDLGADGWALACAGPGGVTLWDPRHMGRPDYAPPQAHRYQGVGAGGHRERAAAARGRRHQSGPGDRSREWTQGVRVRATTPPAWP